MSIYRPKIGPGTETKPHISDTQLRVVIAQNEAGKRNRSKAEPNNIATCSRGS